MRTENERAAELHLGGSGRSASKNSQLQPYSIGGRSKSQARSVPVHAANGRVVGEVRAAVFRKTARASRHMLRRPPAWALDIASLDEAEALGAVRVRILDIETGRLYLAPISLIRSDGFRLNRGYGQQVALALEFWQVTASSDSMPIQLSLFGRTP